MGEYQMSIGIIESIQATKECELESLVVIHINEEKLAVAAELFGGDAHGELTSEIKMTINDDDLEAMQHMQNLGIIKRVSIIAGPCCIVHPICTCHCEGARCTVIQADQGEWADARPLNSPKISKVAFSAEEGTCMPRPSEGRESIMSFGSACMVPLTDILIDAHGFEVSMDGAVEI